MDHDNLCRIAADIHKAASHPAMADILYPNSIRAEWNPKVQAFDRVAILGMKHHRIYPNRSQQFVVRFYAADPTDETSVHKKVAKRMAGLGKETRTTKKR